MENEANQEVSVSESEANDGQEVIVPSAIVEKPKKKRGRKRLDHCPMCKQLRPK